MGANADTVFSRLCEVMGEPELAEDPGFASHGARGSNMGELDEIIASWSREHTIGELLEKLD